MKRKIDIIITFISVIFSLSIVSCNSKYSKKNHIGTIKIYDHLYNEIFKVYSGGALANDSYSNYLTDSVSFRKYIGTVYYDDEELYCKTLDTNRILVYILNIRNKNDTLEKKVYLLSDLKKEGKFE